MTDLETMPVERVDVDTEEITETGEPTAAHIVKTKRGEPGACGILFFDTDKALLNLYRQHHMVTQLPTLNDLNQRR